MRDESTPVKSKRLLRTRDAAQYLSISSWKLRRLIQDGKLPVVQDVDGSPFLLDVRDLDGYIERNKRTASV
jgi:excisionase family DNA binding protein